MTGYIIAFILFKLLSWVGLSKIFEKAGVSGWKAFIPILNWSETLKIIGKPQWWIVLCLIPIVNIFYGAYMLVGLAKTFKKYDFGSHAAAVLTPFAYLPYLGFSKKEKYYGPGGLREGEFAPQASYARGWLDSIIFAVVAAHLIRIFFIEAYKIPTSSMEPTLQIGDYMFVSKVHYGSRLPMTPLSLPLIHHTIPKTKSRAYTELVKWPYFRFPALAKVKRNDIAVFNIPFEYDMQSGLGKAYNNGIKYDSRPVDKREHYIKRVIGMPGDTLEIKDNQVYIDGIEAENPELLQFHYRAEMNKPLTKTEWRELGLRAYVNYLFGGQNPEDRGQKPGTVILDATPKMVENFKKSDAIRSIEPVDYSNPEDPYAAARFPKDANKKGWTLENYGPVVIPRKGETIQLTNDNILTYLEFIKEHEHNKVTNKGNQLYINDVATNEYTFQMDYYWLMGDNRHSSLDSRAWGFVPEDHIVGKPLFIFFSSQGGPDNPGVRWDRFLKKAQDMN